MSITDGRRGSGSRGSTTRVAALTKAGEFDQAAALLRKLGGAHPSLAVQAYQADIQARGGHLAEAEAQYRAVLAKSPRNVQALGGLAGVLAREGKQTEADTLFAQAAALPGGSKVGAARADALRLQARADVRSGGADRHVPLGGECRSVQPVAAPGVGPGVARAGRRGGRAGGDGAGGGVRASNGGADAGVDLFRQRDA